MRDAESCNFRLDLPGQEDRLSSFLVESSGLAQFLSALNFARVVEHRTDLDQANIQGDSNRIKLLEESIGCLRYESCMLEEAFRGAKIEQQLVRFGLVSQSIAPTSL